MSANGTLSPRQRKAVEALVTTGNRRAACQAAGIGPATLYRWLKQPAFQQALREVEAAALADLRRRLLVLAERAGNALEDGLEAADLRLRLRAADLLMSKLLQFHEAIEILERLEKLEQAVEALRQRAQ